MKKRILLSLVLLLLCLAAVFAKTTVSVSLSVTRTGKGRNNDPYKYTVTVTSITSNPAGVITLTYSTSQNGTYQTAEVGDVLLNASTSKSLYLKASDGSYTSDAVNANIGSSNKTVSIEISSWISGTDGLAEDARLFYFPRNVVDNSNVMVNLTASKSISATEAQTLFTREFVNYTESNLALFRIREDLLAAKVESTSESSNISKSITIRIESLDGWTFVNEYNSTRTTTFSLDAFCLEEVFTYIFHSSNNKETKYDPVPGGSMALGASTRLEGSDQEATFEKIGDLYYELKLPYTDFAKGYRRYYPKYIRNADICLNIPEFGSGLEPGYYTTRLLVTIPEHDEVSADEITTNGFGDSFIITIRGYLGIDAGSTSGSSSFFVLSSTSTYSMDLGISSNPAEGYSIARAQFTYFDVVSGAEGDQNDDPRPDNPETKYTIYISSTSDYTDGTTPFRFIKIGSERQARTDDNTIYYTLSWESNNSALDNQTTAPLYMRPKYTYKQISQTSSGNTGRNSYQINWAMDNTIKLYLTDQSLQTNTYHQEGMYYSYIYFTLVTNN